MWANSRKNGEKSIYRNFWYKFVSMEKFWGAQKKLNTGAQLQTFLHAMTP